MVDINDTLLPLPTVDNHSDAYYAEKRREFYAVSVPILLAYTAVVFVLNATVLVAIPYIKGSLNPTLKLTVSLTVTDVWTSALVAFSLTYNSYIYFVNGIETSACVAMTVEVLRLGGFFSGMLHLLTLAVNHYLATAQPFLCKKLMTSTIINTTVALLWFVPTSIIWLGFAVVPGQGYRSPNGDCKEFTFMGKFEFRLIMLSVICLLLIIMSVLYISVVIILHQMKRKFTSVRKMSTHTQRQSLNRTRKMFVTTLLLWGTFFLGWFPSSLMFFLMCSNCAISFLKKDMYLTVYVLGFLSNFFILSKTLANPIVYAVRIPEIRMVLYNWKVKGIYKATQTSGSRTCGGQQDSPTNANRFTTGRSQRLASNKGEENIVLLTNNNAL